MLITGRVDEKAGTVTLVLKLESDPQPSKTGKTIGLASTHGNVPIGVNVNGKAVIAGVNVYVRA